ncbi:MAG: ATP-binding protein [Bacteroidota bacterium]
MEHKAFFNWSSGKDSALALYQLRLDGNPDPGLLLTTISGKYQRISMHGLRRSLLEAQANALGIPLEVIELPENPSMEDYRRKMDVEMRALKEKGFATTYFGDIFLEDLKTYRENMLFPLGFEVRFPIWKEDTRTLLLRFIEKGFKAIVVSVNANLLDKSFCGRLLDHSFLGDLPPNVDPCGENGEFHTFCFDGPIFQYPLLYEKGELVYNTYPAPRGNDGKAKPDYGFWFCDLHPKKY